MTVIEHWTGATATALREAMRLTNERFAEQLGVSVRAVAKWRAEPELRPSPPLQQVLDIALERCDATTLERFAMIADGRFTEASPEAEDVKRFSEPLAPSMLSALDWIDDHANWRRGTAERCVRERITAAAGLRRQPPGRHRVTRSRIAEAVTALYRPAPGTHLYTVQVDGRPLQTSILTRDSWLDTALRLGTDCEQFSVDFHANPPPADLTAAQADAAVQRIADIFATGARFFDGKLYALLDLQLEPGRVTGSFGLTDFIPYALTTDLLEDELSHATADTAHDARWRKLPLRAAQLPTADAALDFRGRVCAGGALSLLAIARPASRSGRPADYVLLIQERSAQVVNGPGTLSVVPKAFHEALDDYSEDVAISATLERELEEELLGRPELEAKSSSSLIDPRHYSRLSPPMRNLVDGGVRSWTSECTGFGVNLASGNYEFAALIAIHDEHWWVQHGGELSGSWEMDGVRRYSSQDHDGIGRLITEDQWSNEGLFAFLQGLRRLAEIAPDRVNLPAIVKDQSET